MARWALWYSALSQEYYGLFLLMIVQQLHLLVADVETEELEVMECRPASAVVGEAILLLFDFVELDAEIH